MQGNFELLAEHGEGIDPDTLSAAILEFPDRLGKNLRGLTNDDVEASFVTTNSVHKLHPDEVELRLGDIPGTFIARHKKLGIVLGTMTAAAVLGVASTVVYKRHRKSS